MTAYPVFLTALDEQRSVVVGAGPTLERKVNGLLEAGGQVRLIAPSLPASIREMTGRERVEWLDRAYRDGDLERALLVIVTEAAPETKQQIWEEARQRNILINTAGNPHQSTFANGACLRRGPLVISISTSGAAPALSVRLRQELSGEIGPEYEEFVALLNALREPMQRQISDFRERRERWYSLVDSEVLDLLAAGCRDEARARVESIVGAEVMEEAEDCF